MNENSSIIFFSIGAKMFIQINCILHLPSLVKNRVKIFVIVEHRPRIFRTSNFTISSLNAAYAIRKSSEFKKFV